MSVESIDIEEAGVPVEQYGLRNGDKLKNVECKCVIMSDSEEKGGVDCRKYKGGGGWRSLEQHLA